VKLIITLVVLFSSFASLASTTSITKIKEIMLDQNNGIKVYLKVEDSLPNVGCRTNLNWPFVIDISTDFGRSLYSALLMSYASKSKVIVHGFGTCTVHNGVETVKRIEFK